jgi:hypothetical protein
MVVQLPREYTRVQPRDLLVRCDTKVALPYSRQTCFGAIDTCNAYMNKDVMIKLYSYHSAVALRLPFGCQTGHAI